MIGFLPMSTAVPACDYIRVYVVHSLHWPSYRRVSLWEAVAVECTFGGGVIAPVNNAFHVHYLPQ